MTTRLQEAESHRREQSMKNLKLAAARPDFSRSVIDVNGVKLGGEFVVIAGPCSVESEEQTVQTAIAVKKAGAKMLRGGAFKPRTSPYAFQGLGLKGLKILDKARKETGLPIVTEVVDTRDVSWVGEYADVLQIGARNMQNFSLLREVGKSAKPILLKRGMYSTLEEWLNCAEYILAEGNPNVILCERGIRTFETYTRNTLDLSMIPAVRRESHLPILIDPSHGTGILSMIEPMSLAALVAGADGLEIEVHIDPSCALSDKDQQLSVAQFERLMKKLEATRAFMLELDASIDAAEQESLRGKGGNADSNSSGANKEQSQIDAETGHFKDSVD
ncbi:MAG: 3-deoxy-7-phosphoheptulonate synthase [Spirochaetia bacterium]|nr:3-deoxy-7-phosphoheptulonate synthase [Spirochaetales bacterium]MDX9783454.1 3-deoxy-7-phosphoheptulonate synthase [Spirochaetia bacterium]